MRLALVLALVGAGLLAGPISSHDVAVHAQTAAAPLAFAAPCHPIPDPIVSRIIDIDPSPNVESVAEAVNSRGDVVGYQQARTGFEAFFWSEAEGLTVLGPGVANGINTQRTVVGVTPVDGVNLPFRWTAATGMVLLRTLGGAGGVNSVNDAGDAVGYSQPAPGTAVHATLWKSDGRVVDLGTLGGDAVATRITSNGLVAGWSRDRGDRIRAFTWTRRSGLTDIGAGEVLGINRRGVAVGRTAIATIGSTLEWPWGAAPLTLGWGHARAINSYDVVVGARHFNPADDEDFVAALWAPGVPVRYLGTLGGCRSMALDTNDRGHVVGFAVTADGYQHATLWEVPKAAVTAVPTLDELGRPETPTPLIPLVSATTIADGRAIRVNRAGQALLLSVAGSSPTRTFLWSKADGLIDIGGFRQSPQHYVMTRGTAMNARGAIVGEGLSSSGFYEPFIWSQAEGIRLLSPSLVVEQQPAMAINDAAEVVGSFVALTSYRWSPLQGFVTGVPLGGPCGSSALAINAWGESVGGSGVAGTGCEDGDPFHAYISPRSGATADLGTLGGARSEAVAINGRGQVAGWSLTMSGKRQAFFWSPATRIVALGTLGGASSWPTAINDLGQVVGTSTTSSGYTHAFFWSARTGMVDMGTGAPSAINGLGQVVGTVMTSSAPAAFLWSEMSGRTTLAYGAHASDINDRGQVVGDRTTAINTRAASWQLRVTIADRLTLYEAQIEVLRHGGVVDSTQIADATRWIGKARESLATGNSTRLVTYLDKLSAALDAP
jgi:probable HAF family extracellular repeat protein